jgi:hypothetical protein
VRTAFNRRSRYLLEPSEPKKEFVLKIPAPVLKQTKEWKSALSNCYINLSYICISPRLIRTLDFTDPEPQGAVSFFLCWSWRTWATSKCWNFFKFFALYSIQYKSFERGRINMMRLHNIGFYLHEFTIFLLARRSKIITILFTYSTVQRNFVAREPFDELCQSFSKIPSN